MNILISKKCIPCTGTVPPLQDIEIKEFLKQLSNQWSINDKGHLYREFLFRNFKDAMECANKIAILAEQENHHPDLYIAWGKCSVEIWTHKISGLTESDFILSAKIDGLF